MNADAFLQSILDDPAGAATTWPILADWLEDQGDARAELVRLCHDPSYRPALTGAERDARVRALLATGVLPCVPAWDNSVGMKLALIPAGTFLMGSPASEAGRNDNEGPQREVEITRPFCLSIHPVTQEQYKKVTGQKPSHFTRARGGGLRHPVEKVTWEDALEFCRKLSEKAEEKRLGRVYRLPTEAEWEYACRGGAVSSAPFHFGDSLSSTQANFDGRYPYGGASKEKILWRTTAVGSYPPNAFGLYDLHGNVWEWCADWFGIYPNQSLKDPTGPTSGQLRVLRGGSWCNYGRDCRSSYRNDNVPGNRSYYFGFRVVCSART